MDWDQDGTFELKKYKTFDFFPFDTKNTGLLKFKQNIIHLKESIEKKMKENGLCRSSTNPDLQINLGIVVEEKKRTRENSLVTEPFLYIGQRSYSWKAEEIPVGTYEEGTITLHLVENRSNRAVWVGNIHQALPKKSKNMLKNIEEVVEIFFKEVTKQKFKLQ